MNPNKKYACPCCCYKTLHKVPPRCYAICQICYWEDDPVQFANPDYTGGANKVSLIEAQRNFLEFGASELEWENSVRAPGKHDKR